MGIHGPYRACHDFRTGCVRFLGAPPGSAAVRADWERLAGYLYEDWQAVPGIGAVRAEALVAFFHHPEVQRMAAQLNQAGWLVFNLSTVPLNH